MERIQSVSTMKLVNDQIESLSFSQNEPNKALLKNRLESVRFFMSIGAKLKLLAKTIGKAVYLSRVFEVKNESLVFDRLIYNLAALFIATKLDEFPIENETLVEFFASYTKSIEGGSAVNSTVAANVAANLQQSRRKISFGESFTAMTEEAENLVSETILARIFEAETEVLASVGFNLNIPVPSEFLEVYAKRFASCMDRKIFKFANTIINDSYHLNICISHRPDHIAVASICFALTYYGEKEVIFEGKNWLNSCIESKQLSILKEILSSLTSLYSNQILKND